jgi:hypothetical protein
MATKPSVFISYRRDPSSDLARYIRKELVDAGAHVFLDVDDIDKGRFENVIRSNIENSESFLLLLAPETLQSEWVRREVNLALEHDKNIIPLMMPDFSMEEHVPEELTALRRLHGIPYTHHYAEAALEKVKKAVGIQKKPASLNLWLTKSGCSFQLTIGAIATILVAVFAAVILPQMKNQNAANISATALDRATSIPALIATSAPTETPTRTTIPPNTTATQVIDFGLTATEAILQLTVDTQRATNDALMAQSRPTQEQINQLNVTSTEIMLQRTVDAIEATNAALIAENTQIAVSATAQAQSMQFSTPSSECRTELTDIAYITGYLTNNLIEAKYRFEGRAGDTVSFSVTALSSGFDPYIILQDMNGNELTVDDDSAGIPNAEIKDYVLGENSMYIFVVTANVSENYRQKTGNYRLTSNVSLRPESLPASVDRDINLRSEPNQSSSLIISLRTGQTPTIIGRNQDSSWLKVLTGSGEVGWVIKDGLEILGNISVECLPLDEKQITVSE